MRVGAKRMAAQAEIFFYLLVLGEADQGQVDAEDALQQVAVPGEAL
jgi:hypothetical protein